MTCTIFVGPSKHGVPAGAVSALNDDAFDVRPPVRRGDLRSLAAESPPGCVAIVDGVFHQQLAVAHWEVRGLLSRGWSVWGLSSMGALRAVEMEQMGMRGFGRVFEYYREHPDTPDDEVTLLHGPAPDYVPISEPLVHLREALACLCREGLIKPSTQDRIVTELTSRWFGDRQLAWVIQYIAAIESSAAGISVRARLGDFAEFRLKAHDLTCFLETRPWEH